MIFKDTYFNTEYPNIKINKLVTGKYEQSSEIDNTEKKENNATSKEETKATSDIVPEIQVEPEKDEDKAIKSNENNNEASGTPIEAELTAYCNDSRLR